MIDLLINEEGGVTVAHTLKSLDAYDALEIDLADGTATLCGPTGTRGIGTLRRPMLDALRPGMDGRAIRTSGWSVARVSPLAVRTRH